MLLEATELKIPTWLNGGEGEAELKESDIVIWKPCCPCYCSGEPFCESVAYYALEVRLHAGQGWSWENSRKIKNVDMH